jgi:elongator complex protein 3
MSYFTDIIQYIKKNKPSKLTLAKYKVKLCKTYKLKSIPTDINILLNAKIADIPKIKKCLQSKPTRSISGVTPVAIMTEPKQCPHVKKGIGPCTMCPGGPKSEFGDVPQSYTGVEPASMRGKRNKYDPYLQVFNRLEQFVVLGHNCEKVELIVMGGTFPSYSTKYQDHFVKFAFKAMNDFSKLFFKKSEFNYAKFKEFFELPTNILGNEKRTNRLHKKLLKLKGDCELETEQKKNEKTKIRCIALCIETRPDYGMLKHANQMLKLGCTRVELGIQSVYDAALERIKRGHTTNDTKKSIQILKDLGFKVAGHYMPGLPGIDKKRDLEGMKKLFRDSSYKPDMLKLYPCMVTKGTELYNEYKKGKIKLLDAKEATELIVKFKKYVPTYCRIQRVQRDIATNVIEGGVEKTNLRQYIQNHKDFECRCIRCREVGHKIRKDKSLEIGKIQFLTYEYEASNGIEFFISAEDVKNDILLGYCRVRIPFESLRKEITNNSALLRELHVYSEALPLGTTSKSSFQHRGLGKKLMGIAEKIALERDKNKVVVISGVGVREYYRKIGYKKEGPYMVKRIK